MRVAKFFRKFLLLGISATVLAGALSSSLVGITKVGAAGESFTWVDAKTIKISGGDLTGSYTASLHAPSAIPVGTPPELVEELEASMPQSDFATVTATHKTGCKFGFTVEVVDSDTLDIKAIEPGPAFNPSGGSTSVNCQPFLYNPYTKTVSTTNNRSDTEAATETLAQKKVSIIMQYAGDPAVAEAIISFTITGDQSTSTGLVLTEHEISGGPNTSKYYTYEGSVILQEGDYEGCDELGVGCKEFTKVKYEPKLVEYGESAQGGSVLVNLTITYTGLSPDELHQTPSIPVTVTSRIDQNVVYTEKTETHLSSLHIEDYVLERSVTFGNIPEGEYTACALSICKDFTKVEAVQAVVPLSATGADVDATFITEDGGAIAPDCYTGLKSSLAWIMCPILGAIDNFIEWAERAISSQLTVDLGGQETRDSLQEAWRIVARLASGILVAIALVMVIATALGSDLISPYALKKVLPRLVIGAIGIWLSWALVSTYIDIMNDLGKGIAGIMLSPFAEAKDFSLQNMAGIAAGTNEVASSGTIFVGLATAGIFSAGIFGILGAGLTALFAFLVAIVVLALRQAVIIFLIILAPLGFAMWILPNTNKVWKLWSGTLNKLLLMYPMIMALLTAGKIFSYITAKSIEHEPPDGSASLDHFLAFSISLIAYVAPYFFLPALFKAAGGLFSNLTGMVNNKGKGLFDKAKGGLQDRKSANRKIRKDAGDQQARMRLAAGNATLRDRARLGFGRVGRGSAAYRLERQRQMVQGHKDSLERGLLTPGPGTLESIAVEEAGMRTRNFRPVDEREKIRLAQVKLDTEAAQARLKATLGADYNDRDHLDNMYAGSDEPTRRAIGERLIQLRADGAMRNIQATDSVMFNELAQTKEFGESFKDSAPDLLRDSAFSSGLSTALITKASKGTFERATQEYQDVHGLISGIRAGTINPASLNSAQTRLAREYLTDSSGNINTVYGEDKLKRAVLTTAASAKLAVTNETLRADFKAPQATEAYKMLSTLEGTTAAPGVFAGLATTDVTAALSAIDPVSGLK